MSEPVTPRSLSARDQAGADRDESGDTLIEILITLVIVSITVVSLIAAFSSSIAASSEYRGLAVTDTLVRTVSEQVTAQFNDYPNTYTSCSADPVADYTAKLGSALILPPPYGAPTGDYSAAIFSVTYWDGTKFGSSCTTGKMAPQEMTISVSGPPGVKTEYLAFVIEGDGQISSATQLNPPGLSVQTSTVDNSGALDVTITDPNNVANQTFTVDACTDFNMTSGCTTPPPNNFVAGLNTLSGLVPGTPYYVTAFANASPGYLASATVEMPSASSSPGTFSSGFSPYPSVASVAPSTSTAGALQLTFTAAQGAPGNDTYTATACTNTAMTANCVSQSIPNQPNTLITITGLTPNSYYFVEVIAAPDAPYLGGPSLAFSPSVAATIQLNASTNVSVASSATYPGALVVNFTAPSNAPSSQAYSVTGCTNKAMTANCVTQGSFTSGNQFTPLTAGASYYVTVTALASTHFVGSQPEIGYLSSTSAVTPNSTEATIKLNAPVITGVGPGNKTGRIVVNYSGSSNAPGGQTYTLTACTDQLMTMNCVTNPNYVSGHNATGLQPATSYWVTVTANASTGYLASSQSAAWQVTSS